MFYVYIISSPNILQIKPFTVKVGCTGNPYDRRSTYLTGCPPGMSPSHVLEYRAIFETNATSLEEVKDYEEEVHNIGYKYRLMHCVPNDSEWFDYGTQNTYNKILEYI